MKRRVLAVSLLLGFTAAGFRLTADGRVDGVVRAGSLPAAGAVVFLARADGAALEPTTDSVMIDQVELRFVPQVVAVVPGTTVTFPNSDPILHNVFSPRGPGDGFNLGTYPPGEIRSHRFTEPGVHVILCHVHPEMVAYVAVVATRLYAVADSAGHFTIDHVPAGLYALKVYLARRTALQRDVQVTEGGTTRLELQLRR